VRDSATRIVRGILIFLRMAPPAHAPTGVEPAPADLAWLVVVRT
jgi:hypothetical protein